MLPHGAYSLIPAVLTTMGWLASLFQDGCDFSRLSGTLVSEIASDSKAPWLEVGFAMYREPLYDPQTNQWNLVYSGQCLQYPGAVDIDGVWKISKGFAFLALVLGGGGTIFLWFSTCCVFSRGSWQWAGFEVMFACLFQALAFSWFRTSMCQENQCDLSWGSKGDIVATMLWFVSVIFVFAYYPQPKEYLDGDGLMVDGAENASGPSMTIESGGSSAEPELRISTLSMEDIDFSNEPMAQRSGQDSRQNAELL
jgi:hypothetical protein